MCHYASVQLLQVWLNSSIGIEYTEMDRQFRLQDNIGTNSQAIMDGQFRLHEMKDAFSHKYFIFLVQIRVQKSTYFQQWQWIFLMIEMLHYLTFLPFFIPVIKKLQIHIWLSLNGQVIFFMWEMLSTVSIEMYCENSKIGSLSF